MKKFVLYLLLTILISGAMGIESSRKEFVEKIINEELELAGSVYGIIGTTNIIYGMDKFNTKGGNGFAAERANHLADKLAGKHAKIIGDSNAKNGADRLVNGIEIQSKYYDTASNSVGACFENGIFKYLDANGKPMTVEVPSDQYDDAIVSMENRIKKGEVTGVNSPLKAKDIIKKGHITYRQSRNIAKFGTIESLTFDAVNGAIIAGSTMGISASITFARSLWNNDPIELALKNSCIEGIKVGGLSFFANIISSQLSRTGMNNAFRGGTDSIVKKMGPKFAGQFSNAFRSGPNIYGAVAMNNVSKLLRINIFTGCATIALLTSYDVLKYLRGFMSLGQLLKNLIVTTATVTSGTIGWVSGTIQGIKIGLTVPIIGTGVFGFALGIFGALLGGGIGSFVTQILLDLYIEDDSIKMLKIIEEQFIILAEEYLLSKQEVDQIASNIQKIISETSILTDIFRNKNPKDYLKNLLVETIESVKRKRKFLAKKIIIV